MVSLEGRASSGRPMNQKPVSGVTPALHSFWRQSIQSECLPDALRLAGENVTHGITLIPERLGGTTKWKSYEELYRSAQQKAAALHARGVAPGDRVLLVLPSSLDFVEAFFAIQILGAVPVPAYPPVALRLAVGRARLKHIANDAGARFCVTDERVHRVIGDLVFLVPCLEDMPTIEDLCSAPALASSPVEIKPEDLAFIQYTSGSTGNPKGVCLTHANLVANIRAIGHAVVVHGEDIVVGWCPLYHDLGLIGTLLFSIYWRIPFVLMSPMAFLRRPHRWLRAIHDYRGTLSPAPNFAYALGVNRVPEIERQGIDLSSWRCAIVGAEPICSKTIGKFIETYKDYGFSENSVLPAYGLAEGCLAATFYDLDSPICVERLDREALGDGDARPTQAENGVMIASVGRPVQDHEVVVVDDTGLAVPERRVGHIVVKGPSIMQGYYKRDEATREALRGDALWTGDLGYLSDGYLFVTGRSKDIIILNGRNYYAEDIESAVEEVVGIRRGCVVAFGVYDDTVGQERVVVVCESRLPVSERERLRRGVMTSVLESCSVNIDDVVVAKPGTIPKTSSGKRQRRRCRQLYLQGTLQPRKEGPIVLASALVRSTAAGFYMRAKRMMRRCMTSLLLSTD